MKRTFLTTSILAAALAGTCLAADTNTTNDTDKSAQASPPTTNQDTHIGWDDKFFDEMRDIQQRMDSLFNRAWSETKSTLGQTGSSGFSSAVNLSTENDKYIVRLSLPQRDMDKVNVTVDPQNVLHVVANDENQRTQSPSGSKDTTKSNDVAKEYSLTKYEQLISLPGPVDSTKMKVDRSGTSLTITLPKSGTQLPGQG